jgi:cytoskeleton protein RodZ
MTEKFNARSPGEILRAAREKQGLHIAALAASIKVAPRKLDALEHDRWDELPDATFVRALAQTVCRTLKIDPAPVMELLPRAGAPALQADAGGLNTPFRERPGRDEPGLSLSAVRPMVLAAALLMAAALAVYFVPASLFSSKGLSNPPAAPLVASGAAAAASVAQAPALEAVVPAASAAESQAAPAAASAADAGFAATPAAATAVMVPTAASAAALPASTPAAVAGPVVLRARNDSWIEVREAGGRVLFSRVLAAGEQVGLDGALPIRMTIGNASGTELDYRGQAFDLKAVTINNVARVELK